MEPSESLLYWLWLSERCGAVCRDFPLLMRQYPDPFDLYRLSGGELERLQGIHPRLKERLGNKDLEGAYRTLSLCQRERIQIIPYFHEEYPERLRQLIDPPVLLFVKGTLPSMNRRLCMGVVGTRKVSEYGRHSAYTISYELAKAGAVIVSGMALGVDGVAACGALAAGVPTVAVLGCGVSVVYPKQHKPLYDAILRIGGAIVSEYPPFAGVTKYTFPQRNRIISGLCQGLLVVEGTRKSGSLITAEDAMRQGRDLFAIPGQINDPLAEGPNLLIREGAHAVLDSSDIFNHYAWMYRDQLSPIEAVPSHGGDLPPMEEILTRYGVLCSVPSERASGAPVSGRRGATTKPAAEAAPKKAPAPAPKQDDSRLLSLDPSQRRIYELLPLEGSISMDALLRQIGDPAGLSLALMQLEMNGLCVALPGGQFRRK